MARTPTRTTGAPTGAAAAARIAAAQRTAAARSAPAAPTRAAPAGAAVAATRAEAAERIAAERAAQAAGPNTQQMLQAARASISGAQQTGLPAYAQHMRQVSGGPQTQPLPPSGARPALSTNLGQALRTAPRTTLQNAPAFAQNAAARMTQSTPTKTGAPLPSGMSLGGGQPAPPSRTSGNMPMPTMAGGPGGMKKGGKVKKMAKGGSVSSASKRGDGCATKGRTKGRFV